MIITENKMTQSQFEDLSNDMVLDLIALFSLAEEHVARKVAELADKGATPEDIISQIEHDIF